MNIYAVICAKDILHGIKFMGWYQNKEDAVKAVKKNTCDINETIYDYAIVEEIPEGLYVSPRKRWVFKYNLTDEKYYEIEEPEGMLGNRSVL